MNRKALLYAFAELGPVVAFFVAGQVTDFFTAAAILMGMTVFATLVSWHYEQHVPVIPIVSALSVCLGGGLTLWTQNETWLIFSDSVFYAGMGLLLVGTLLRGQLLLRHLFSPIFAITDAGWRVLSWRWALFILLAATANEYVRHLDDPALWIEYRFFKTIVFLLFILYQFTLAKRYRLPEESNMWGMRIHPPKKAAKQR